jgi:hypothetical protein
MWVDRLMLWALCAWRLRYRPEHPRVERVALFHPRTHQWWDHFAWSADFTRIEGKTSLGRATIEVLRLNRPGVVNLRRVLAAGGLHPPSEPDPLGEDP